MQIKNSKIDSKGKAQYDEKIDMKTQIEWNADNNSYKPKLAQLSAHLSDGSVLGTAEMNLADYENSNTYNE